MKQLVLAFLKCLSFIFLFRSLQTLTLNSYAFKMDDTQLILYVLIDASISLMIFFALLFKTEPLVNLFKVKWESTDSVAYPTILKTGIFLIGFYFFTATIGGALSDLFLYVKQELSTTGGNSGERFIDFITPVTFDSFLPKLVNVALGFLIAFNAGKITNYFLKRDLPKE